MSFPRDIKEFLDGYPDHGNDLSSSMNLGFYSNTLRCRPDNRLIDEIHEQWFGDYDKLEYKHGYIQWLFPIQEHGVNFESQPLQRHEIVSMKSDPKIMERVVTSYNLMLDFYGMRLVSLESGLIDRSLPPRNYVSRYRNLVRAYLPRKRSDSSSQFYQGAPHNNLRISRILKCLSEFGFEHLNVGFLLHVACEQSESGELNTPAIRSSMDRWWANCIRNGISRKRVGEIIAQVRLGPDGYIFTREMYKETLGRIRLERAD